MNHQYNQSSKNSTDIYSLNLSYINYNNDNFLDKTITDGQLSKNDSDILETLIKLINNIKICNLKIYYPENSNNHLFIKRINRLNQKFYSETEKSISCDNMNDLQKSHTKLFIILFKQISIYNQEIERLNKLLIEKEKEFTYMQNKYNYDMLQENEKSKTQTYFYTKKKQINFNEGILKTTNNFINKNNNKKCTDDLILDCEKFNEGLENLEQKLIAIKEKINKRKNNKKFKEVTTNDIIKNSSIIKCNLKIKK